MTCLIGWAVGGFIGSFIGGSIAGVHLAKPSSLLVACHNSFTSGIRARVCTCTPGQHFHLPGLLSKLPFFTGSCVHLVQPHTMCCHASWLHITVASDPLGLPNPMLPLLQITPRTC